MKCNIFTVQIFFLFSIDIKRTVFIASTTQTITYIHEYNYADISSIFFDIKTIY